MNEQTEKIFSIHKDNRPVKGCTVSREIHNHKGNRITYFSLDENTDISPEIYSNHKLLIVSSGHIITSSFSSNENTDVNPEVHVNHKPQIVSSGNIAASSSELSEGDSIITPVNVPVGVKAMSRSIYAEIDFDSGGLTMNEALSIGEVFRLSELVPYQDGRIINMDVVHNDKMKFAVMAFSEGTGLSEHAAPGDALIFALDGEGIIGYEGKEYHIEAGENFRFAKNGRHYVKAEKKFKMALLLTLE